MHSLVGSFFAVRAIKPAAHSPIIQLYRLIDLETVHLRIKTSEKVRRNPLQRRG